jgi:hypothetical protein
MIDYMKRHERYVQEMLQKNLSREALLELIAYHDKQISWIQQERLAHLITMLFVCLFFLLSFGFTMANFTLPYITMTALLLILSVAYIIHYYRLENGLQKWYSLSNDINTKLFSKIKI